MKRGKNVETKQISTMGVNIRSLILNQEEAEKYLEQEKRVSRETEGDNKKGERRKKTQGRRKRKRTKNGD